MLLISTLNLISWIIGGITLTVSLVALVIVIISYFKTKNELHKRIKQFEENKEKYIGWKKRYLEKPKYLFLFLCLQC